MATQSNPEENMEAQLNQVGNISEITNRLAENRAKIANIDAEINGGALVEVANILGKPLLMRVNHHDPDLARHELAEMRSLIKDVVYPEYDFDHQPSEYTVEEYAAKQRVSKQTVWRWIRANKIKATRIGKSYRIAV